MKTTIDINTDFLKEWQPFDKLNKMVERKLVSHFLTNKYQWQPTHQESSKQPFNVYTLSQIDAKLGLAYTSSSAYAALWVNNAGYLWADPTHYFVGFAINTDNEVIGIAYDEKENEIYVTL